MGGRIASQVAAIDSDGISRLAFLGYPLHLPGRADKLRDKHLPSIRAPMDPLSGGRPFRVGPIRDQGTVMTTFAPCRMYLYVRARQLEGSFPGDRRTGAHIVIEKAAERGSRTAPRSIT
jgi:hypothetical protein